MNGPAPFELGLRGRALVVIATTAIVSSAVAGWATLYRLRNGATEDLARRALIIGRALEESREIQAAIIGTQGAIPPEGNGEEATSVLRRFVAADQELAYVVLVDSDGEPFLHAFDPTIARMDGGQLLSDILLHHLETEEEGLLRAGIVRVNEPLTGRSLAAPTTGRRRVPVDEPTDRDLPAGVAPNAGTLRTELGAAAATALLGLSPAARFARGKEVVATGFVISGVLVASVIWLFFSWLYRRIRAMGAYAHKLSCGDLTERFSETSHDQLGELGRALESIAQNLGDTISRVRVAALVMDGMSGTVRDSSRQIAANASTQAQAVQETASAMESMSRDGVAAETQIQEATHSAEDSTARLRDISAAVESIAVAVAELAVSVDQAQAQVRVAIESVRDVDGIAADLHEVVEGATTAATEISANISSVDHAANRAFEMSSDASARVAGGVDAVRKTREGIEEIRLFTGRALEWIRFLSDKVMSIEQILDVITDIANQTRLLSLNASIIASQAGEHGRGFMVVAGEIKALAGKTAGSTREITGVINEVLSASGTVMDVVEKGVTTVDEAMMRSEYAGEVLDSIHAAATQTGKLVRRIAGSVNEQSRGAQRVERVMQDVHATANNLRDIVRKQKRSGGEAEEAIDRMRTLMTRALTTSGEQTEPMRSAISSMAAAFEQIHRIGEANNRQASSREEVARAIELLERMSTRHQASAQSLTAAVDRTAAQSAALSLGVKAFRV
jgi:methyl-accepting chemotaxis protein